MGLSAAMIGANTALSNASRQISVVSNNIDGANVQGYARKSLLMETGPDGYAEAVAIGRATDKALSNASMSATSKAQGSAALSGVYDQLEQIMGASNNNNPMSMLSQLQTALQQMSSQPSNIAAASSVVGQASSIVDALHQATSQITAIRLQTNSQLADAATNLNKLLAQFGDLNTTIAAAGNSNQDVTAALDQRDQILSQISQYVGISTVERPNGSMALYTDSGVVLFDGNARQVTFDSSANLTSGSPGPALKIDGVDVTSASSPMQVRTGTIAALTQARDVVAVNAQGQLDEFARGLITTFAESDRRNPPSAPTQPGLFTYPGAPAMPGNSLVPGLAGSIQVAANVDPSVGGNPMLIRDGGISDPGNPAYLANTTGAVDFSDRINELINAFSTAQPFDSSVGVVPSASLTSYASSAMNVFENNRQKSTNDTTQTQAVQNRANQALSNATGVNLDDETAHMLEIERSYQTAAKLISTIDSMFQSFLQERVFS